MTQVHVGFVVHTGTLGKGVDELGRVPLAAAKSAPTEEDVVTVSGHGDGQGRRLGAQGGNGDRRDDCPVASRENHTLRKGYISYPSFSVNQNYTYIIQGNFNSIILHVS